MKDDKNLGNITPDDQDQDAEAIAQPEGVRSAAARG